MKKTLSTRIIITIAGILAAIVIVFSQSLQLRVEKKPEKDKTEQQSGEQIFISAPDAVAQTHVTQLNEQTPLLLQEELIREQRHPSFFSSSSQIVTSYFKVLFRAIISPNAP